MDDYDFEETDDSSSALNNLENSAINLGTDYARSAINNSSVGFQPSVYQQTGYTPISSSSSSSGLMTLLFIALIGFILYKVL